MHTKPPIVFTSYKAIDMTAVIIGYWWSVDLL